MNIEQLRELWNYNWAIHTTFCESQKRIDVIFCDSVYRHWFNFVTDLVRTFRFLSWGSSRLIDTECNFKEFLMDIRNLKINFHLLIKKSALFAPTYRIPNIYLSLLLYLILEFYFSGEWATKSISNPRVQNFIEFTTLTPATT